MLCKSSGFCSPRNPSAVDTVLHRSRSRQLNLRSWITFLPRETPFGELYPALRLHCAQAPPESNQDVSGTQSLPAGSNQRIWANDCCCLPAVDIDGGLTASLAKGCMIIPFPELCLAASYTRPRFQLAFLARVPQDDVPCINKNQNQN